MAFIRCALVIVVLLLGWMALRAESLAHVAPVTRGPAAVLG